MLHTLRMAVLAITLCVWASPAHATAYTSTGAGNWSVAGNWSPGTGPPGNGDTAIVQHAITVDANTTVGASVPPTPTFAQIPSISLATGSTTSLGSGGYDFRITFVDSNGRESASCASIGTGNITSGSSKPRVTMPALPTGIVSINLYLSTTPAVAGAEHLYATGITASTYDMVSALWNNGTQSYAAAPVLPPQGAVVVNWTGTGTGSLTIATGVKLVCRGDMAEQNSGASGVPAVTGTADGILELDNSQATTPSATSYALWQGSVNAKGCLLTTSGTSQAHPFTIRTNSTAGNKACRIANWYGAFGNLTDVVQTNVSYVNFTTLGDTTNDCWQVQWSAATYTETFLGCNFNACGAVRFLNAVAAGGGWSFQHCTWSSSNAKNNATTLRQNVLILGASVNATGTRLVDSCVFDQACSFPGFAGVYTSNIFRKGWDDQNTAHAWTTFDSNLIINPVVPQLASGPLTNNIYIWDNGPLTATVTSTLTGATGTTLQDTGVTGWTSNGFRATAAGLTSGWMVLLTSGAGAGQVRSILSNTATGGSPSNQLTLLRAWDTTPTAGDGYQIIQAAANVHFISPGGLTSETACAFTGNILWFPYADNNGDGFQSVTNALLSFVFTINGNILLPSAARDNTATLLTGSPQMANVYVVKHNTVFTGAQSMLAVNETGAQLTGTASVNNGSTTVTFSNSQTLLSNRFYQFSTDATNGNYEIVSGAGTTWTLASAYAGTNTTTATVYQVEASHVIAPAYSNIAWCDPAQTYGAAGTGGSSSLGPYKVCDSSIPSLGVNFCTWDAVALTAGVSQADYNCGYGNKTSAYAGSADVAFAGGTGYACRSTVQMGTHDVNANPQFRNPWATPVTWGQSLGLTGNIYTVLQSVYTNMMLMNSTSFDSRYSFAALQAYLQSAITPLNAAIATAAQDGTTIGALPWSASAVPTGVQTGGGTGGNKNGIKTGGGAASVRPKKGPFPMKRAA